MASFMPSPLSFMIVILFFFLVIFPSAETLRIPFTSMSKLTVIWGTPLRVGGIPEISNFPNKFLFLVRVLSLPYTWAHLRSSSSWTASLYVNSHTIWVKPGVVLFNQVHILFENNALQCQFSCCFFLSPVLNNARPSCSWAIIFKHHSYMMSHKDWWIHFILFLARFSCCIVGLLWRLKVMGNTFIKAGTNCCLKLHISYP